MFDKSLIIPLGGLVFILIFSVVREKIQQGLYNLIMFSSVFYLGFLEHFFFALLLLFAYLHTFLIGRRISNLPSDNSDREIRIFKTSTFVYFLGLFVICAKAFQLETGSLLQVASLELGSIGLLLIMAICLFYYGEKKW